MPRARSPRPGGCDARRAWSVDEPCGAQGAVRQRARRDRQRAHPAAADRLPRPGARTGHHRRRLRHRLHRARPAAAAARWPASSSTGWVRVPCSWAGSWSQGAGVALLTQVDSAADARTPSRPSSASAVPSAGVPQSALLGRLTTPDERTRVFGIQFMILNLGIGIGGIVAATIVDVAQPATFQLLYVADALTYLLYVDRPRLAARGRRRPGAGGGPGRGGGRVPRGAARPQADARRGAGPRADDAAGTAPSRWASPSSSPWSTACPSPGWRSRSRSTRRRSWSSSWSRSR